MKPILSYLLASLFILAGCTNEIEGELCANEVPIRVEANRLEGLPTKTSITSFSQEEVAQIGIIKAIGNNCSLSTYNPASLRYDNQLSFANPPLIYPSDDSEVSLSGYSPLQSATGEGYTISDNNLSFTLTGQEDLMWAQQQQAGTKSSPIPVSLSFGHKLAKVTFVLINEVSGDNLPTGTIGLIAKGATSGTMNLQDGTISANIAEDRMALAGNLTLADLTDGKAVPGELLILPETEYSFLLSIAGGGEYPIILTNPPTWMAGTAYQLTITIKALTQPDNTTPETKSINSSPTGHSINASIIIQE